MTVDNIQVEVKHQRSLATTHPGDALRATMDALRREIERRWRRSGGDIGLHVCTTAKPWTSALMLLGNDCRNQSLHIRLEVGAEIEVLWTKRPSIA